MRISWYVERARRMSLQELGLKTYDRMRQPWVMNHVPWRTVDADLRHEVSLPFEAIERGRLYDEGLIHVADRVLKRDRWILGRGWVPASAWDWLRDPGTQELWPLSPSYRLNYRRVGKEIRLTWELNRFHDLTVLAQAYWMTGEKGYLDELLRILDEWTLANPVGLGPNWVSAMEVAIRIVNMTWVARMLSQEAPHVVKRIGHEIAIHALFVEQHLSFGSSANNHLLLELMGLVVANAFWTLSHHPDLTEYYGQRFTAELDRQTNTDGLHCEMSSHYHLLVTESAVHVQTALTARHLAIDLLDTLVLRMRQVISAITVQESMCRFGDDDEGHIVRFPDSTMSWEKVLAGTHDCPWLPAMSRESWPQPSLQNFDGLVVFRTEAYRMIVDAGPTGLAPLYAHAHDDGGSMYLAFHGHWFLIDPGTGAYFRDWELRKSLMEAAAHNAPSSELAKSRLKDPFVWDRTPQRFHVLAHEVHERGATVTLTREDRRFCRTIIATPEKIRIIDESRDCSLRLALTISSAWMVSQQDDFHFIAQQNHRRLSIQWTSPAALKTTVAPPFGGAGKHSTIAITCEATHKVEWEVTEC